MSNPRDPNNSTTLFLLSKGIFVKDKDGFSGLSPEAQKAFYTVEQMEKMSFPCFGTDSYRNKPISVVVREKDYVRAKQCLFQLLPALNEVDAIVWDVRSESSEIAPVKLNNT